MTDDQPARQKPDVWTIVVPGVGRVTVEPDVASVRLGVAITRPTASAAREGAAETMAAILDAIVASGVDRRDLRTSLLGLGPLTDYSAEGGPRVTGYQLTNSVDVTVRDLAAVGRVIDEALSAGATSLDNLAFRLDDADPASEEARRAAVADARNRATTLAEAAGVTLGSVVGIVEGVAPVPFFERGGVAGMALKADVSTPVEAGTHEISVSVVVSFAIEGADGG